MKNILVLLLIILTMTGCNQKNDTKLEVENNQELDNNQIVESETLINNNSKYQEDKIVDGILFSKASLVQIDENCLFEVNIKNQNLEACKFEYVKITLLDSNNNKVIELFGLVTNGTLNPNEEKTISSYYNGDIKDVYDVKYEIVK